MVLFRIAADPVTADGDLHCTHQFFPQSEAGQRHCAILHLHDRERAGQQNVKSFNPSHRRFHRRNSWPYWPFASLPVRLLL
jgi:hypothetical protein